MEEKNNEIELLKKIQSKDEIDKKSKEFVYGNDVISECLKTMEE